MTPGPGGYATPTPRTAYTANDDGASFTPTYQT